MDWAATLRKEAQRSAILRSDDIARRYGIVESAVGNALRRQERRGLVEHISNKVYINKLAHDFSPREVVGASQRAFLENFARQAFALSIATLGNICIGASRKNERGTAPTRLRNQRKHFWIGSTCSVRRDCPWCLTS